MLLPPSRRRRKVVSTSQVFQAAITQGVGLMVADDRESLLPGHDGHLCRGQGTHHADSGGKAIPSSVPAQSVTLNGTPTTAWYQVDPTTGETIAVTQDGGPPDLDWIRRGARDRRRRGPSSACCTLPRLGVKLLFQSAAKALANALNFHSLPPLLADIRSSLSTQSTAEVAGLPELGDQFTSLLEQVIGLPLPGAANISSLSSPGSQRADPVQRAGRG